MLPPKLEITNSCPRSVARTRICSPVDSGLNFFASVCRKRNRSAMKFQSLLDFREHQPQFPAEIGVCFPNRAAIFLIIAELLLRIARSAISLVIFASRCRPIDMFRSNYCCKNFRSSKDNLSVHYYHLDIYCRFGYCEFPPLSQRPIKIVI